MRQKIIGFYQDEFDDWVAQLTCGHGQHVRHNPPWNNRAWVLTEEGRTQRIGVELDCKKCDRGEPVSAHNTVHDDIL